MITSTTGHRQQQHARVFLIAGIALLVVGVVLHEWTISYLLQPEVPLRLTARLHWWYISLNAWAVGIWLILWRRSIHPLAVLSVALLYSLALLLLVAVDFWRAYHAVASSDSRTTIGEYHVMDDQLGWRVKPRGKARIVREGVYDVSYKIDPEGRRTTIPYSETSRRIYVFGDSFAFGWGVNDHETFSSRLAAHQRDRATVLNLGVEGYGVTQIYARLSQVLEKIQPGDIVIFTVIGDDIHRSWPDFVFVSRMLFGQEPLQHFPVFESGTIRVQATDSLANRIKALLVYAPWMGSLFGPLLLPRADQALNDSAQMLELARHAVEARGARFMLVQLPTGGELRKQQVSVDLTRLGALQLKEHFPTDPESLKAYFLNHDDGHYSPMAHALVGDILHSLLSARGWVTP